MIRFLPKANDVENGAVASFTSLHPASLWGGGKGGMERQLTDQFPWCGGSREGRHGKAGHPALAPGSPVQGHQTEPPAHPLRHPPQGHWATGPHHLPQADLAGSSSGSQNPWPLLGTVLPKVEDPLRVTASVPLAARLTSGGSPGPESPGLWPTHLPGQTGDPAVVASPKALVGFSGQPLSGVPDVTQTHQHRHWPSSGLDGH